MKNKKQNLKHKKISTIILLLFIFTIGSMGYSVALGCFTEPAPHIMINDLTWRDPEPRFLHVTYTGLDTHVHVIHCVIAKEHITQTREDASWRNQSLGPHKFGWVMVTNTFLTIVLPPENGTYYIRVIGQFFNTDEWTEVSNELCVNYDSENGITDNTIDVDNIFYSKFVVENRQGIAAFCFVVFFIIFIAKKWFNISKRPDLSLLMTILAALVYIFLLLMTMTDIEYIRWASRESTIISTLIITALIFPAAYSIRLLLSDQDEIENGTNDTIAALFIKMGAGSVLIIFLRLVVIRLVASAWVPGIENQISISILDILINTIIVTSMGIVVVKIQTISPLLVYGFSIVCFIICPLFAPIQYVILQMIFDLIGCGWLLDLIVQQKFKF